MKNKEKNHNIKDIYNRLNDSEKFGVTLGLFPVSLSSLSQKELTEIMKIAEINNQSK